MWGSWYGRVSYKIFYCRDDVACHKCMVFTSTTCLVVLCLHSYGVFWLLLLYIIKFKQVLEFFSWFWAQLLRHKLRIISHISKKNWNNFWAVQNKIIRKKLSTMASCLSSQKSESYGVMTMIVKTYSVHNNEIPPKTHQNHPKFFCGSMPPDPVCIHGTTLWLQGGLPYRLSWKCSYSPVFLELF